MFTTKAAYAAFSSSTESFYYFSVFYLKSLKRIYNFYNKAASTFPDLADNSTITLIISAKCFVALTLLAYNKILLVCFDNSTND